MRVCNNLRSAEVQQMCALLGDVLANSHAGTAAEVVQNLASRLTALFAADICMIGEVPRVAESNGFSWSRLSEAGWRSHEQRLNLLSSLENPATIAPTLTAALSEPGDCVTRTRRELVADDRWYNSTYFTPLRSSMGLDDELISVWSDGARQGWAGLIWLHRAADRPAFEDAAAGLLDVLHRQLGSLIWASELIPAVTLGPGPDIGIKPSLPDHGLTPAQLRVVPYLLQGYREDEIANLMCRSRHTIHDHVMAVYKAFRVHSRADLIVKLGSGRGFAAAAGPQWPSIDEPPVRGQDVRNASDGPQARPA